MKKITILKKTFLSLLVLMVISGTISFSYGQTITPTSHSECEYFIGTLTYSVKLLKGATYQWYTAPYRSTIWTPIKYATSNVLSLTFAKGEFVRDLDRTQFKCKITPQLGFAYDSDIALLYVLIKPTISSNPVGGTKYVGESITFSVTASGSTPRYYQWQFNSGGGYIDIPGATSTSHTIGAITMENAGAYRCKVTNDCGYVYSVGATLTVLEPLYADGWFAQSSGTSKDIRQISAISEYNAWAVTNEYDQLLHTIDGGETWSTVYMVDAGASPLGFYGYSIWFTSSTIGYVGGYNGVAITTNGGTSWTKKDVKTALGLSDYFYAYDMYFYNSNIGWIVGNDGLIAYTSDGGTNWTKQNWGKDPVKVTDADLKCVYFQDSQNGWIGGASGVILKTTNGGTTWVLQAAPEAQTVIDIQSVSTTKVFAVGQTYRALYHTENGGDTWTKYSGSLPTFYAYSIDFTDADNGWMAGYGYKNSTYIGFIMRTNDGGLTWYSQSVENPEYLYHMVMVDADNGWAVGKAGEIQRTAFGGCLHPTMNLYEDTTLCSAPQGFTIIADSFKQNDNVFYSWNTGATTGKLTVFESGEYEVVVTNLCGETASDSKVVSFYPLPVANAGEDKSICPGDTTQLFATGGVVFSWSPVNTLSDPVIQNPRAFPITSTYYTVNVTDTNGCVGNDQVLVTVPYPYEGEEICLVSVDPETEKNMVIWEKTENAGIASYNIYREGTLLGNLAYNDLSVFVDSTANPRRRSYFYKISVIDTCGNESGLSNYHKPIFLQYVNSDQGVNLSWSNYEVEGGAITFTGYTVFRGSDSTDMSPIEDIPLGINTFTDDDPLALQVRFYYRVSGNKSVVCDPANLLGKKAGTGPYSQSMSNLEDNRLQTGIKDLGEGRNSLNIYPNPFRNQTRISYRLDKTSDVRIEIYNLLGARTADIVHETQNPGDFSYDLNASDMGVAEGIFYLRFTVNRNTTVKKLILTK